MKQILSFDSTVYFTIKSSSWISVDLRVFSLDILFLTIFLGDQDSKN